MEYQRMAGKPLEHAIRSEFSGHIEDGLLAISELSFRVLCYQLLPG